MSRQNESDQELLHKLSRIIGAGDFNEPITPAQAGTDGVVRESIDVALQRTRLKAAEYLRDAIRDKASFDKKFHNVVTAYRIFNLVNQFNAYVTAHADQAANREKAAQATYAAILHLMEETIIRSGRAFGQFNSELLDKIDIVPPRNPQKT